MNYAISKTIRGKSDFELINILKERQHYELEALKIAIDEIRIRKNSNGTFTGYEIDILISSCENEILEKERTEKERINAIRYKKNNPNEGWVWLPKAHFFDLLGYYSLVVLAAIILSFPYFETKSDAVFWLSLGAISFIPFWQGNIISTAQTKRAHHFNQRLIYSAALMVIVLLRSYFIYHNFNSDTWVGAIFGYLLFLAISGIVSIPFYFITIKKLSQKQWYFIGRLRLFIPITALTALTFVVMEEGWFIEEKQIAWNEDRPLTIDDFRGYPDFFTHYDGAISSFIDYEFNDDNELVRLEAVCNSHRTWANPWDADSYSLLIHEQYHFNVTEVATRMARKNILDTLKFGTDRSGIESIILRHRQILDSLQDRYDEETDHSIISNMQGYWQFKVDSLLYELDPFWTSKILKPVIPNDTVRYFRFISTNSKNQIIGKNPLLSGEQEYASYYKFRYSASGTLERIDFYAQNQLSTDNYYEVASILRSEKFNSETLKFYNVNGTLINNNNGYAEIRTTYKDGQIKRVYFNDTGKACRNSNGAYGELILLDSFGRYREKILLDLNGNRANGTSGFTAIKYYYEDDSANFYNSLEYFDFNGKPTANKFGVGKKVYVRDENGNLIFEGKLDIANRYLMSDGFAYKKRKYDELGHYIELAAYDSSSNLVQMSERNARLTWSHDRYGNVNRVSSYNTNNVLVGDEDGVASYYYKYDNRENLIVMERYGTGDEMIFEDGYGKKVYEFDSLDRMISLKNYNAYGYPIRSEYNSFCYKLLRDSSGFPFEIDFYNKKLEPDTTTDGAHRILQKFDGYGNLIEKSYYDLQDKLIAVEEDVAIFQFDYDDRNNKIESRFYNVERKLARGNQDVSVNKYKFNDRNKITERTYYDSLGQLSLFDGVAKFQWVYDEKGNEIEEWRYDKFGQLLDTGIAVIKNKYDERGNRIEIRNFNKNLNLVTKQAAIVRIEHNEHNEIIKEEYLNHKSEPSIYNEDSVHLYEYLHDEKNNYMGAKYIGIDGHLIEVDGIAQLINERNERGNIVATAYFNSNLELTADENGVSVYRYEYDDYDRQVDIKYLNTDSLTGKYNGYFSHSKIFRDRAGNIVKKIYYDESGELTMNSDSVSMYIYTYDRNGNYSTRSYGKQEASEKLSNELTE